MNNPSNPFATSTRQLHTGWRFTELNPRGQSAASDLPWMDAQVPGHVHLDLVRNNVIQHPFEGMAERACAWVDETDWVYETTFTVDEAPAHAYLRFNGLDTIAEIYLNDVELARTDNMFIPHEFFVGTQPPSPAEEGPGVRGCLKSGENTLRVIFRSALRVGRERLADWEAAGKEHMDPHWARWAPRSFVRKAQYMYGWDWGPELVSCGIWKSVELIIVPVARLVDWNYEVLSLTDDRAEVKLIAEIDCSEIPGDQELTAQFKITGPQLRSPGVTQAHKEANDSLEWAQSQPIAVIMPNSIGTVVVDTVIQIENPRLWDINGTLDPNRVPFLYVGSIDVQLDNKSIGHKYVKFGLRTIELVRELDPDGKGECFLFNVNGEPRFMKGANWIPTSSFPEGQNEAGAGTVESLVVYRQLIEILKAGYNMLRVWGGGVYESEEFYKLCDSFGILVWQDFPFGCAYYPDTDEYAEAVRVEATAAVKRLRRHPSLALWCGNNENHEMYFHGWEGEAYRAPRYLGEHLYHDVLPAVVAAEDPKTPYWPSSPFGGEDPQSEDYGDRHNWNVWHTKGTNLPGVEPGDWPNYLMDRGRFSSEFGFASSCGLKAWEGVLRPEDRSPRSPVVQWHDKTRKGYEKYLSYIGMHFPEPQTLEDLVYYSQINQAEALKCGIEHWRRQKGRCWGTLFWQLNDCWPVQSWAVIDSALVPKAAFHWSKKFYAPVLLSLFRNGNVVEAHLVNDLLEHIQGDATISVESFDGEVLRSETIEANIDANGVGKIGEINVSDFAVHFRDVYIYATFEPYWDFGQQNIDNFLFLAEPKDLRLADPGLTIIEDKSKKMMIAQSVTVRSKRFAPYVWLEVADLGSDFQPQVSNNFFHVRPGVDYQVTINTGLRKPANILSAIQLRSL